MDAAGRLLADIAALAGEIGVRHPAAPGSLERAAAHIARRFTTAGLTPRRETFAAQGHDWCNLVAELPGPGAPLLVCAHYDSIPGGPGASDNASGVAILLELAQRAAAESLVGIRFLACANEEGMRLDRDAGGSWHHLRTAPRPAAALVLDSLGCRDQRVGSQAWPSWWMPLVHGTRGDFLCVQAHWRDRALARTCARAARAGGLPVRGCWWPGQCWQLMGDQESLARAGIPVVTLTDTDRFRNPRYHRPGDVPASVDAGFIAGAAAAAWAVLQAMAGATPIPGARASS